MSEIGVKLTGDNSEYRSMLSDSAEKGAEFGAHLTEKVGDKLFGLREISHTVATALGLNLEKIAENVARLFSGMSEEEEEFYKKSSELSDKAADMAISNIRAQASDETRYTLLLKDRDDALARINKRNEDSIDLTKAQTEFEAARFKYNHSYAEEDAKALHEAAGLVGEAMKQEKERAATLAANSADQIKAQQAIAELRTADAARAKADQERFALGEKEAADTRKQHDADQKKALDEADKVTKEIFDTQSKQEAANEKLIAQAKARAVAEAAVATEFEKQLSAIQAMAAAKTPGGLRSDNSAQTAAAEAALLKAENAPQGFSNPNYARDVYEAQLLVDQLHSGQNASTFNFSAAADAAFGSRADNATQLIQQQALDAAKQTAALNKSIDAKLSAFFDSIGTPAPSLDSSPYPAFQSYTDTPSG